MTKARFFSTLLFVAAVSLVSWRAATNLNVPGRPDMDYFAMADFRDAIYYPVVSLLDGNNPYDHETYQRVYPIVSTFPPYSPLTLLVHLPLGLLALPTAELIYYIFNVLLFLPIAAITLRLCGIEARAEHSIGLASLLILSRPGQSSLFLGQYAPTMVLAGYVALHYARSRPGLAAVGLALTTMKPTFGVPLLVLLGAFGATRAAVLGVALGLAGAAAPAALLIHNAGGLSAFIASTWAAHAAFSSSSINSVTTSLTRVDIAALLGHWVGTFGGALPGAILCVSVLSLAAAALYGLRARGERNAKRLAGAIVLLATLVAVYHQAYDALLLAFPQVAVLSGRLLGRRPALRATLGTLLLIPAINYLSSFRAVGALAVSGEMERILASVNGLAMATALTICLTLAVRNAGVGWMRRAARDAEGEILAVHR